jgi:hypothetical protein
MTTEQFEALEVMMFMQSNGRIEFLENFFKNIKLTRDQMRPREVIFKKAIKSEYDIISDIEIFYEKGQIRFQFEIES